MEITQLWLILMLLVLQGWWCGGCLEEERIALLQFKASVDHLKPDSLSDWVEGGNCCNWEGLYCNTTTGRVTELAINGIKDPKDWYLNTSLFLPFKELRSLSLSENGITGYVENEGFEKLSVLNHLEDLVLSDNNLDGSILSSLSAFSFLKKLHLDMNKIEGLINIQELNNLTSLMELNLGGNVIRGFKSFHGREEEVLKLKNLEYLDLSYNLLDTDILSQISGLLSLKNLYLANYPSKQSINNSGFERLLILNHLEDLDLSGNNLDGNILSSLSAFSSLKRLSLGWNQIEGSIDIQDLNNLISLTELDLRGNAIQGFKSFQDKEEVLKLKNLEHLHLSNNLLDTNILSQLSELLSLVYLDLSKNQLKGSINISELNALSNLDELYLNSNWINQFVASTGGEGFLHLNKLRTLDLSDNHFNNNVLLSLKHLSSLEYLELANNQIKGAIHMQALDNLTNLEELYLDGNKITKVVASKDSFTLTNFKTISLSNNSLEGTIFDQGIWQFKHLETLVMDNNNLNGELPSCLANLTSLQHLNISSNHIKGNIPSSLGEMQSLEIIDLFNNHLQGGIPNTLSNCSSLSYLDLSNNSLSGRLPTWMGNMSNLQYLALSQNHFFGTLTHGFNLPFLEYLDLSQNNIGGSLTKIFYNCSKLITLDVSHNNFTGGISKRIKLLSDLSFLLLSYNNLEGEIPIELCKLQLLRVIDLSNNNFFGHIQPCILSITYKNNEIFLPTSQLPRGLVLTTKNASYHYRGIILFYLYGIDLSCNNLKGEIPGEFGNLSYIQLLNLSHNSLIGEIPPTFSNLKEIETLDLSFNNLNGSIPLQLTRLNSLSSFSVAHNNLSGRTPERVAQFGTFEETSYRDNPYLCGQPLPKNCNEDISPLSIPKNDVGSEAKNELIDMDAFKATFLASYPVTFLTICVVLYINPQWRRASFHLVEQNFTKCYYFVVDNIPFLSKLGFS